jgi:branched-chain amino acid transport system permease protein
MGTVLLQAAVTGTLVGLAYAILGVGFSLTWGATGIINASHAVLAVFGAYIGYFTWVRLGLDPLLSAILIVPLFFVLGVAFYEGLVRPLKARIRHAELASVVLTLGVAIIIENVLALVFTADPRLTRASYVLTTFRPGSLIIPGGRAVAATIAVVVLLIVAAFLYRTYAGRAVRAVEQEPEGAALSGIDVRRVSGLTYGIAFATAGLAGLALSFVFPFAPGVHLEWLVVIFLVVILGGVGSVLGITVAGLLTGMIVAFSTLWVPFAWVNLVLFTTLILTLTFRPTGLFAR